MDEKIPSDRVLAEWLAGEVRALAPGSLLTRGEVERLVGLSYDSPRLARNIVGSHLRVLLLRGEPFREVRRLESGLLVLDQPGIALKNDRRRARAMRGYLNAAASSEAAIRQAVIDGLIDDATRARHEHCLRVATQIAVQAARAERRELPRGRDGLSSAREAGL